jgi:hypothetical protein
MKIALLTLAVILTSFFTFLNPIEVEAQAGGLVTCSGSSCSICHVVDLVNNVIIILFSAVGMIFAVLMMIAGFGLITSGGNQSALDAAKSKFSNAIIGLIIVMGAWLLVDTVVRGLLKGEDGNLGVTFSGFGPWSEVECVRQTKTEAASPDATQAVTGTYGFQAYSYNAANTCQVGHSGSYATLAECESAVRAIQSSNPESYVTKMCDDTPATYTPPVWAERPICTVPNDPGADGRFAYQSGIEAQAVHIAPKMNSMLSCMASKVPANVGTISSISDSLITSGTYTWSQCRLASRLCAHVPTSYHYGNSGRCGDQSYAVDFGDENNASVLCQAANACGPVKNCSVHNGNHVHLEIACP